MGFMQSPKERWIGEEKGEDNCVILYAFFFSVKFKIIIIIIRGYGKKFVGYTPRMMGIVILNFDFPFPCLEI